MSYRDEIKVMIENVLESTTPSRRASIDRVIKKMYAKALEETKRSGASVESMTYEILEGIEAGLLSSPEEMEASLERASCLMADLLHHSAQEEIKRKQRRIDFAKEALSETIEAEKMHLIESLDAFRAFAREHRHQKFQKSLHMTGSSMMKYVLKLAGEMMYNHKQP